MYILFRLKNCFKCICLHLEFECFASKLEMTTSYAWSRPLSLWWWHVLLSVTWSHKLSRTQLTWCIYCNSLPKEVWSSDWQAGRGLSTHSFNSWFCYTVCEFGERFTPPYTDFHVSYIHKYERGTPVSLSVPLPYLTEMSCREMLYSAIDPKGVNRGFVLKLTAGFVL